MAKNKVDWNKVHIELERQGKFDEYTTPFSEENLMPVDENYDFLPENFGFKLSHALASGVVTLFGPLVTFFTYGLRIKGKKKIKALKDKGIISVSSHIGFLDCLMMMQVYSCKKRVYVTVAPHNNKKGLGGNILRASATLPLSENLSALKNFNRAIDTIMERKQVVHFYAERAMWVDYNKPRPMKKGAFTYAAKTKSPVVPLFYEVKPSKGLRKMFSKYQVTVHVLDPIFPKEELSTKKNTDYLHEETMWALIDKYRECFNVDRDNIYDVDPKYYDSLNKETALAMTLGRNRQKVDFRTPVEKTAESEEK